MVEMFFILDHKCHCCYAIWNHKSRLTPWTKRKGLYFNSEMFVIKDFKYIIYEIKNIFSLNPKLSLTCKFLILFSVYRIHYLICKKNVLDFFSSDFSFHELQRLWRLSSPTLPRSLLNCSSFILTEIMKKNNYKLYIIVKEITLLKLSMYLPHQTLYVLCTIIRHILFRIYTYIVVRPWVFDKIQIF